MTDSAYFILYTLCVSLINMNSTKKLHTEALSLPPATLLHLFCSISSPCPIRPIRPLCLLYNLFQNPFKPLSNHFPFSSQQHLSKPSTLLLSYCSFLQCSKTPFHSISEQNSTPPLVTIINQTPNHILPFQIHLQVMFNQSPTVFNCLQLCQSKSKLSSAHLKLSKPSPTSS
jgi:hypothetical protein